MPRPVKDVAAVRTLQIIGPTLKHEKRPWKNRKKKHSHCKFLRWTSFDAHSSPISPEVEAFKPGAPPSVDVASRGRFSAISLKSMHEWEYTWICLGQQQQVAPRSAPILHCTGNALKWDLCGILSKFGHARSLWLLGSSLISKSPMQMCTQSSRQQWQLKKGCLKHDLDAYFLDFDNSYLPGVGLNHDHGGGYPRARLLHCTPESVDPCDFPKCGKLGRVISVSGDLRSR